MLGCADSIFTIQRDEADFVRQRLPGHRIIRGATSRTSNRRPGAWT